MGIEARTRGFSTVLHKLRDASIFDCVRQVEARLLAEREVHIDDCADNRGFAVEQGRLVHPLLYRVDGSRNQQWMTADELNIRDTSILVDDDA